MKKIKHLGALFVVLALKRHIEWNVSKKGFFLQEQILCVLSFKSSFCVKLENMESVHEENKPNTHDSATVSTLSALKSRS